MSGARSNAVDKGKEKTCRPRHQPGMDTISQLNAHVSDQHSA
jgi:hypothetical protein